jgi:hypothetical protein
MRTTQFKRATLPVHLFVSAKCATALPIVDALTLDYLTQASLDPAVYKLEYISNVNVCGQNVRLDAILVHRHGRRFALNIDETSRIRDEDEEGLVPLAYAELGLGVLQLTAADVTAEPRFSNARTVWHHHGDTVSHDDRAAVCGAVEEHGALSIRHLDEIVGFGKPAVDVVYPLACEGALELDILRKPLGPLTTVRLGSNVEHNPCDQGSFAQERRVARRPR